MKIEIVSKTESRPFELGQQLDSVMSALDGFPFNERRLGDSTIPNSRVFIVSELDIKLGIGGDGQLVYAEFFNKPTVDRPLEIDGVEYQFNKPSLKKLKAKGHHILIDDSYGFLVPDLNMRLSVKRHSDQAVSCIYSTETYFQGLVDILHIEGEY